MKSSEPSHSARSIASGRVAKDADYFYLPKAFLQQASFQVMNEQRLTEETAKLY
jgi:hypothetical protein